MDPEEIARRARIRHESLMAKRERAEALRREATALRVDVRLFVAHVSAQADALNRRLAELAGRIGTHLDEIAQEETSIVGLPVIDPRRAETDRLQRPG